MVRSAIREIVSKEIEPRIDEIDKSRKYPFEIVKLLIDHDIHRIPLLEEYGGYNSVLMNCLAIEELSKASVVIGYWLSGAGSAMGSLKESENEEAKRRCFEKLARGEIAGFSITEPDAGSDVAAIKTTAILKGGEYVINGEKCFITNGGAADFYILFAKVKPEKGLDGIGAFVVEKKWKV